MCVKPLARWSVYAGTPRELHDRSLTAEGAKLPLVVSPEGRGARVLPRLHFPDVNGSLTVLSQESDPFHVARTFCIVADSGMVRGEHAHRSCSQFIVCLTGHFSVEVSDGTATRTFELTQCSEGLLVPPMIWAKETARRDESVLLVLCDEPFDEAEYLRDFDAYVQLCTQG